MLEELISVKRAEAAAGVIAVIHGPGVGGGLQQLARIQAVLPPKSGEKPGKPAVRERRGVSFQGHQVSQDVVHILVGVLSQQFVVRGVGIVLDHL